MPSSWFLEVGDLISPRPLPHVALLLMPHSLRWASFPLFLTLGFVPTWVFSFTTFFEQEKLKTTQVRAAFSRRAAGDRVLPPSGTLSTVAPFLALGFAVLFLTLDFV
jgi:hypothetical protein